ncbi:MAG: hypothetical protein P8X85_23350 [Desulfobacterales bacterium]
MNEMEDSIEVGKLADFCIIEDDIISVDLNKISENPTLMAIVGARSSLRSAPELLLSCKKLIGSSLDLLTDLI